MSDDQMQDQVERAEDDRAEDAVEAHMQDAPNDGAPHATEEPPDVEGHMHGGRPVDPKPID